jgi:hypothetical protein
MVLQLKANKYNLSIDNPHETSKTNVLAFNLYLT